MSNDIDMILRIKNSKKIIYAVNYLQMEKMRFLRLYLKIPLFFHYLIAGGAVTRKKWDALRLVNYPKLD